jgi:hypothetical protein
VTVTGRQLIDFVNARGEQEVGVCVCGHWWEEHHDGTCDACLESAVEQDEPHAVADHEFVYSDEGTAESEYLSQRARELGFPFEEMEPEPEAEAARSKPLLGKGEKPDRPAAPPDSWFIDVALQEYQREGFIEIDVDKPEVSCGEAGAYVKAWLFVEYPSCEAPIGIHVCVRRQGHDGPHACDDECNLGHLREDQLAAGGR